MKKIISNTVFIFLIYITISLLFLKFYFQGQIPVPYRMDYVRFLTEQIRVVENIKQNHFPLWNPYILCGMPAIANVMSNLFSPFIFLYFVFKDPVCAYVIIMILELLILGISFFFMMQSVFKTGKIPAYIASISFVLCGFMFWIHNMSMKSIEDLLFVYPLAFLFYYKLRNTFSIKWAVMTAVILATGYINCNGSVLQYGYNMVFLFLFHIFCAVMFFKGLKNELKITSLAIFALILSIGLCSFQFLPVYEAVNNSTRFASGEVVYAPQKVFPTIISFFYPDVWPKFSFVNKIGGFYGLTYGVFGYCGIPALILAFTGIFYANDRKKWFFALYPAMYLIIWPLYSAETTQKLIPSFLKTGNHLFYSFYLCSFSVAVLTGLGCEVIRTNLNNIKDFISLRKISSVILRFIALILGGIYIFANICLTAGILLITYRPLFIRDKMLKFLSASEQFKRSDTFYQEKIDYILEIFRSNFALFVSSGIIKLSGLILLSLLIFFNVKHKKQFFYLSLIFTVLDFIFVGYQYLEFLPRNYYYPETETVKYLQSVPEDKNTFRVGVFFEDSDWFWNKYPDASFEEFRNFCYSLSDSLHENILIRHGFQQIGGYEGLCPFRQFQYFKLLGDNRGFCTHGIFLSQVNSRLLDLANMKYVVSSEDLAGDKFEKRFSGKRYSVYFNKSAFDRVFMVPRAQYIESETELFDIMTDSDTDFSHKVFISEKSPDPLPEPENESGFISSAVITKYTPNEVLIETKCSAGAWLVFTDAYNSGWSAQVDSASAQIYPANILFRTVYVDQGEHTVKFNYFSRYMKTGLIISFVSVLICASIIVLGFFKRKTHCRIPADS